MSTHPDEHPTGSKFQSTPSTGTPSGGSGISGKTVEIPDQTLSPAMEELATALADLVPDPAVRLSVVHQCFHPDRADAPFPLALQALTGAPVSPAIARDVWTLTLEVQQRWSDRVGEVVSLRSAAMEALDRCHRTMQTRTTNAGPGAGSTAGSSTGSSAGSSAGPAGSGLAGDSAGGRTALPDSNTGSLREYLDRDLQTGLYLRPAYEAALRAGIKKASPEEPLSLILFAVEDLTALAPERAEELSARIAEQLRHHCRRTDIPCRYSPDHFAVLMPSASAARAQERAEKLLQALRPVVESFDLVAFGGGSTAAGPGTTGEALENGAAAAVEMSRQKGPWSFTPFRSTTARKQGSGTAPGKGGGNVNRLWLFPAGVVAAAALAFGGWSLLRHPASASQTSAGQMSTPRRVAASTAASSTAVASAATAPAAAPAATTTPAAGAAANGAAGNGTPANSAAAAGADIAPHEYLTLFHPGDTSSLRDLLNGMPADLHDQWKRFGGQPENTIVARGGDTHIALFAHARHGSVWYIWQTWPDRKWYREWQLMGQVPGSMIAGLTKGEKGLDVLIRNNGATWRIGEVNPNSANAYWSNWVKLPTR